MNKRVLMIAFHFPPCHGSSGLLRTLSFARNLPEFGWDPALLTVSSNAYEQTSESLLHAVPDTMPVVRAPAFDTARHLSIAGRYFSAMAVPDRWSSWRLAAPRAAAGLIDRFNPDLVWSTYPIATAHQIAASTSKKYGLPWIADMRDPMVEFDKYTGITFPEDKRIRKARLEIEEKAIRYAAKIVFCTSGAKSICENRYPDIQTDKLAIVSNGYDEESFSEAAQYQNHDCSSEFTLLHSGTIYPGSDRGPEALFQSLKNLNTQRLLPADFRLVLRAVGHDTYVRELIDQFKLSGIVEIRESVSYDAALREMLNCSALLLLQGPSSNPAIPAKVYEYFRARKPILALVHPEGDTASLLKSMSAGILAAIDDCEDISSALQQLIDGTVAGELLNIGDDQLPQFSRKSQASELAEILSSVVR